MKKKLSIVLTLIFLMNILFVGNLKVKASTSVPAKFGSISVDKTRVTSGESVNIVLNLIVGSSSLRNYAILTYIKPNGNIAYATLNYDGTKFVGKIDITDSNVSGTWEIIDLSFGDSDNPIIIVYNSTISEVWGDRVDLTGGFFEVYGTNVDIPVLKNFSVDKTTLALQEYATIRAEVTSKSAPLQKYISFSYMDPGFSYGREESFALKVINESYENGVYSSVYEGKFKSDFSGYFKIKRLFISNTAGQETVVLNSPDSKYWRDWSAYNITVSDAYLPGPKVIATNVDNYSSNVPLLNELTISYDKNIKINPYYLSSEVKILDDNGTSIPFNGSYSNNTIKLQLTNALKYNTQYKLTIPEGIVEGEDGPVTEQDYVLSFTTGDETTIANGLIKNIVESTEINSSMNIKDDLIIAPGVTLKINSGAELSVSRDVIVYGTLINNGTLSVGRSLYVNNYNDQQIGNASIKAGKFIDTGIKNVNNMVIGNYPKPWFFITPNTNIQTPSGRIDLRLLGSPLLTYNINSSTGIIPKEGLEKQSLNLNYGQNTFTLKVMDPFGNAASKNVTINNTSTPLMVEGTYPLNNATGVPLYGRIIIKFNKPIQVAKDAIILDAPFQGSINPKWYIEDDILNVLYDPLFYNSQYKLTIKAGKVTDNEYNPLQRDYTLSFTTGQEYTRLAGTDRYETSAKISQSSWLRSDYVVLATGETFPDALCAGPLAAAYAAPILLTEQAKLSPKAEAEILRLRAKEVFIIGGTGAVSSSTESYLKSKGIKVTRIAGLNRYDTSLQIAKYLGDVNEIFVATGDNFPDTLSIAAYAAYNTIPILLTPQNNLPTDTSNYIKSMNIAKSYVIGGSGVVSDSVLKSLPYSERIAGKNRYETNLEALSRLEFDFTNTFLATGSNFPDALSGSALAGLVGSPIILVDSDMPTDVRNVLRENRHIMKMKYILGGTGVVPEDIITKIYK